MGYGRHSRTTHGHRRPGAVACCARRPSPSPSSYDAKVQTWRGLWSGAVSCRGRLPSPGRSGLCCTSTLELAACVRTEDWEVYECHRLAHQEDEAVVRASCGVVCEFGGSAPGARGRADAAHKYSRCASETGRRSGAHPLAGTYYVCSTCRVSVSDARTMPAGVLTSRARLG